MYTGFFLRLTDFLYCIKREPISIFCITLLWCLQMACDTIHQIRKIYAHVGKNIVVIANCVCNMVWMNQRLPPRFDLHFRTTIKCQMSPTTSVGYYLLHDGTAQYGGVSKQITSSLRLALSLKCSVIMSFFRNATQTNSLKWYTDPNFRLLLSAQKSQTNQMVSLNSVECFELNIFM